jgi:hypothetical protein
MPRRPVTRALRNTTQTEKEELFLGILSNPGEVLFFVSNLEEAKVWYGSLLDAPLIFDGDGYCSFLVDTTRVGLHPAD